MVHVLSKKGSARLRTGAVLMLLGLWSPPLSAQSGKTAKETAAKAQAAFKVPFYVMVVRVSVVDAIGNPVTDLTAEDFKLFDGGKPQDIPTFALES